MFTEYSCVKTCEGATSLYALLPSPSLSFPSFDVLPSKGHRTSAPNPQPLVPARLDPPAPSRSPETAVYQR